MLKISLLHTEIQHIFIENLNFRKVSMEHTHKSRERRKSRIREYIPAPQFDESSRHYEAQILNAEQPEQPLSG